MSDEKNPSYLLAFEERQKQIGSSIKSEHRGEEHSRDPEIEMKPARDSQQLAGEGARQ